MLGFKDPDRGKTIEAVDILTQQPGITYAHSGYQEKTIPPKARVQVHLAGPSANVSGEQEASHGDTQDPEVPNLDKIADKAKNDKKLEDKYNKLEGIIKTLQGVALHGGVDAKNLSLKDFHAFGQREATHPLL
ncbi:hypothetical protein V6N11_010667 [Hibiscus sabdariffa]|uniref:Uncharacterized protein n=1 Tax=Hibiscus sabdariffa TaxID=183260 RepID=A0ABR2S6S1_9ROSI